MMGVRLSYNLMKIEIFKQRETMICRHGSVRVHYEEHHPANQKTDHASRLCGASTPVHNGHHCNQYNGWALLKHQNGPEWATESDAVKPKYFHQTIEQSKLRYPHVLQEFSLF